MFQGLGEELAKQFSAHGAYLVLSSRKIERLRVCLLQKERDRMQLNADSNDCWIGRSQFFVLFALNFIDEKPLLKRCLVQSESCRQ